MQVFRALTERLLVRIYCFDVLKHSAADRCKTMIDRDMDSRHDRKAVFLQQIIDLCNRTDRTVFDRQNAKFRLTVGDRLENFVEGRAKDRLCIGEKPIARFVGISTRHTETNRFLSLLCKRQLFFCA